MFAATVDDAGNYRLSIRRIRTIDCYHNKHNEIIDLRFKSRAKAKSCADELNDKWLKDYDANFMKSDGTFIGKDLNRKYEIMDGMINIIESYM